MKRKPSKKIRIFLNLLLIALLLGLLEFLMPHFFLIPEVQFRRLERRNLVGPSTILGKESIDHSYCDEMYVAETEDGVILWLYGRKTVNSFFLYREKYAENMILAPRGSYGFMVVEDTLHLPIVLFDETPRAARAEIAFTLNVIYNGEEFEKSYRLEADRTAYGYFRFTLEAQAENEWEDLGAEAAALLRFCGISTSEDKHATTAIPVEITFYDVTGKLIETDTVFVRSDATITLEESGVTP